MKLLRHALADNHPVLQGARMLRDEDIIAATDETACVSTLLSFHGEQWTRVEPDVVGKTVAHVCSKEFGDMDRNERVYIRRHQWTPPVLSGVVVHLEGDVRRRCPKCGGSLERKGWFGLRLGECMSPGCDGK